MIFEELAEVLDPEPHGAALNMAIDESLLRTVRGPLLRIYRWSRPAVSFGYFGKIAEAEQLWPGREPVRRWTGGGIVPHGEDITYTLIVPPDHALFRIGPVESYRAIHACVARVLAGASLAAAAAPKASDACFANPVQHDILIGGQKAAGAAQRRSRAGMLHQGSIQCADPDEAASALPAAFSRGPIARRPLSPGELAAAARLAEQRYATDAWLRRR
jgi:lipoyl(octanoyl) transferase